MRSARDAFCYSAIAPDGTLCGATDLRVPQADARFAHVGIASVLDAHRGHRLGLHLKLAALRAPPAGARSCRAP